MGKDHYEGRDHNEGRVKDDYNEIGYCNGKVFTNNECPTSSIFVLGMPIAIDLINPENLCFSQSKVSVGTCDLRILAAHITRPSINSVTEKSRQQLQSSSL